MTRWLPLLVLLMAVLTARPDAAGAVSAAGMARGPTVLTHDHAGHSHDIACHRDAGRDCGRPNGAADHQDCLGASPHCTGPAVAIVAGPVAVPIEPAILLPVRVAERLSGVPPGVEPPPPRA